MHAQPDDYCERLENALDWIRQHRVAFSFRHGRSHRDELVLLKPFAEFLLVQSVLGRDPAMRARLEPDWRWAWEECGRGEALLSMLQARPDLFELVTIAASLRELDFENPRLRDWIRLLYESQSRAGELPAWRIAALRYHLATLGFGDPPAALDANSWIACRPEPWIISEERLYAFTHHVFYVTDFGRHPERMPDSVREYIDCWLPVWAGVAVQDMNYDLVGELLLVALHLRQSESIATLAPVLCDAQQADGSFPGLPSGASSLNEYSSLNDDHFYRSYHPTLVGTLGLAALRSRDSSPRGGTASNIPEPRSNPDRTARTATVEAGIPRRVSPDCATDAHPGLLCFGLPGMARANRFH
jgi:hypothetical protein